jgi:hypothetical protein
LGRKWRRKVNSCAKKRFLKPRPSFKELLNTLKILSPTEGSFAKSADSEPVSTTNKVEAYAVSGNLYNYSTPQYQTTDGNVITASSDVALEKEDMF